MLLLYWIAKGGSDKSRGEEREAIPRCSSSCLLGEVTRQP